MLVEFFPHSPLLEPPTAVIPTMQAVMMKNNMTQYSMVVAPSASRKNRCTYIIMHPGTEGWWNKTLHVVMYLTNRLPSKSTQPEFFLHFAKLDLEHFHFECSSPSSRFAGSREKSTESDWLLKSAAFTIIPSQHASHGAECSATGNCSISAHRY